MADWELYSPQGLLSIMNVLFRLHVASCYLWKKKSPLPVISLYELPKVPKFRNELRDHSKVQNSKQDKCGFLLVVTSRGSAIIMWTKRGVVSVE